MFLILRDNVSGKLQHTDVEGSKRGRVGVLITSARTGILRFTSHKTNIYVFTLLKNRGYKMSNVTLAPICKTECFAYIYFRKKTLCCYKFPREASCRWV